MDNKALYPQFFRDRASADSTHGTWVRYNSPVEVCLVALSQTGCQLGLQYLSSARLVHTMNAATATEADFVAAFERARQLVVHVALADPGDFTRFECRPGGYLYRNDGLKVQLRLSIDAPAEGARQQQVNIIYENFGLDARFAAIEHQPDGRRVPSTHAQFALGLGVAMGLVLQATHPQWVARPPHKVYHFTLDEPDYSGEMPEAVHTYLGSVTAAYNTEAYYFLEKREYCGFNIRGLNPAPGQPGFRTNLLSFAGEFTGLRDVLPTDGLIAVSAVEQGGGQADA